MIIINKKGMNVTWILTMIIISLLSFFVYLGFFAGIMHSAVSNTDDLQCRAYIVAKSVPGVKMGEFFFDLNQKCKIDPNIKIDLKEKDEAFEEVAIEMSRCWYRYGEGEYDFLSNFDSTGNWCFLCGKVEMKDNSESVSFKEYVDWTKKNNYNRSMTYFNYTTIKQADVDGDELNEIRSEYFSLLEDDPGAEMKQMLYVLGEQITQLDELRMKQFDSNDGEMYVVYRFDRVEKSLEEKMKSATTDVVVGMAGGIVVSIVAEGLAEAALMGTIGAVGGSIIPVAGTGTGALVGGVLGFGKGIVKGIWKTGNSVDKVLRISKMMKKVGGMVKKSKSLKKVDDVVDILDVLSVGKKDDIAKLVDKLEDTDEFKEPVQNVVKMMDDLQLDDLNKIDDFKNFNLDKLDNVMDLYNKQKSRIEKAIKSGEIKRRQDRINQHLDSMGKSQVNLEKLSSLDKDVYVILNKVADQKNTKKVADLSKDDAVKLSDYFRTIVVLGSGGLVGGYVGAEFNGNFEQYVDILSKEQYYRLCGTEYYPE